MFRKTALAILAASNIAMVVQTHTAFAHEGGGRERANPTISIGGQPLRKPEEPVEQTTDPKFGKFLNELADGDKHLRLSGEEYRTRMDQGR